MNENTRIRSQAEKIFRKERLDGSVIARYGYSEAAICSVLFLRDASWADIAKPNFFFDKIEKIDRASRHIDLAEVPVGMSDYAAKRLMIGIILHLLGIDEPARRQLVKWGPNLTNQIIARLQRSDVLAENITKDSVLDTMNSEQRLLTCQAVRELQRSWRLEDSLKLAAEDLPMRKYSIQLLLEGFAEG